MNFRLLPLVGAVALLAACAQNSAGDPHQAGDARPLAPGVTAPAAGGILGQTGGVLDTVGNTVGGVVADPVGAAGAAAADPAGAVGGAAGDAAAAAGAATEDPVGTVGDALGIK